VVVAVPQCQLLLHRVIDRLRRAHFETDEQVPERHGRVVRHVTVTCDLYMASGQWRRHGCTETAQVVFEWSLWSRQNKNNAYKAFRSGACVSLLSDLQTQFQVISSRIGSRTCGRRDRAPVSSLHCTSMYMTVSTYLPISFILSRKLAK
jgi:hypothetical protein